MHESGEAGPVDVEVQQAHAVPQASEGQGQVHRHRRLAHTTLRTDMQGPLSQLRSRDSHAGLLTLQLEVATTWLTLARPEPRGAEEDCGREAPSWQGH